MICVSGSRVYVGGGFVDMADATVRELCCAARDDFGQENGEIIDDERRDFSRYYDEYRGWAEDVVGGQVAKFGAKHGGFWTRSSPSA